MRPEIVETSFIDDPHDVDRFLEAKDLSREGILSIRDASHIQLVDCSPLMATNAPGTLAHHYGLLEMRVQFLGANWEICRAGGIEGISHSSGMIKLIYQNVDVACSRVTYPMPRSEKGSGCERECQGNLFEFYGISAPQKVRVPKSAKAVYFVMVDVRGAVEVSRPVIENGKFSGFIQRVFVSDGSDIKDEMLLPFQGLDEPVDDFDVTVRRRSS